MDKLLLLFLIKYPSLDTVGHILPQKLVLIIMKKIFTPIYFYPSQEVKIYTNDDYDDENDPILSNTITNYFSLDLLNDYDESNLTIEHVYCGKPFEFHVYGNEFAHVAIEKQCGTRSRRINVKKHIITNRIEFWEQKSIQNKNINVSKYACRQTKIVCEEYTWDRDFESNKIECRYRFSPFFDTLPNIHVNKYSPPCSIEQCCKSHDYIQQKICVENVNINQLMSANNIPVNYYSNECFDSIQRARHPIIHHEYDFVSEESDDEEK